MNGAFDAVPASVSAPLRAKLETFARLLLERNAALNLTAARDPQALAAHVADSLSLLPYVRDPLLDVGSGGGFPALPLAIVTGIRATLVESVAKKARFLREVVAALELPVSVVAQRAELAAHDVNLRERFNSATARAIGPLPTVLELTVPFLALGGVALLQRGQIDERERAAADDAALMLGAEIVEEFAAEGRRRVLVALKRTPTSRRFPRRPGIPAKRPLCLAPGEAASYADG